MIRGGETMSDSVFKHDLANWSLQKMGLRSLMIARGAPKSGEERLKKFATIGVIGGEAFASNHFDNYQRLEYIFVLLKKETALKINALICQGFRKLDRVLRHRISLRNFALTLTKMLTGWTKSWAYYNDIKVLEQHNHQSNLGALGLPNSKSLASTCFQWGQVQSEQLELRACVNFIIRVSNALMHFLESYTEFLVQGGGS
ncbi:hypothetical protein Tco_0695807 [Tanacetum coccineum]